MGHPTFCDLGSLCPLPHVLDFFLSLLVPPIIGPLLEPGGGAIYNGGIKEEGYSTCLGASTLIVLSNTDESAETQSMGCMETLEIW